MSTGRATAIGFSAILLWSLLAFLTVQTAPVPPFQLTAMAFLIGGIIGLVWIWRTKQGLGGLRKTPWTVWVVGVLGLFGYHFFYFSALRTAPAAQAGLVAYLWPLFIVLFSGLLPGETLKRGHVVGALVALSGAAMVILAGGGGFSLTYVTGYSLAFLCALTWSGYSIFSRRAGQTPTQIVTFFCLFTAALSLVAHLAFEETRWPNGISGWLYVLALGLGPVGLAFYLWDVGVKKGNIQMLGVASYAAPLLSTIILVATGIAAPTQSLLSAAVLISIGALIAARASRTPNQSSVN